MPADLRLLDDEQRAPALLALARSFRRAGLLVQAISAHQAMIRNVWSRNNVFQISAVSSQIRFAPPASYASTIAPRCLTCAESVL